jgi:C1A family cysteine protease
MCILVLLCDKGWAFAAASQIESDAQRVLGVRYMVSPQQIIACDEMSNYCSGGWPETAYDYVRRTGGIEREASYPYVSSKGSEPSCRAVVDDYVLAIQSPASMISRESNSATENAMAYHLNNTGPLTVCVDATKWNSYVGGVVTTCGGDVNHCLQVVGIHVDETGKEGFWRLRNSWGSDWGEGGHIRLKFGKDTCAITHRPTFTTPHYADSILRQPQD